MENMRITPATNFEELTRMCREHVKNYEQYKEDLKTGAEEWKGYSRVSMPTAVIRAVAQYGADNIWMIGADYHGLYEDDYCYFSYWNDVTGEEFEDTWTTAGACPPFGTYEWFSFADGWNNNKVDKIKYVDYRIKFLHEKLDNITPGIDYKELAGLNLKVRVTGGRKWKGIGYLVGTETSSYRYATPMFRNHPDNYGVSTTTTAKIYDPKTNTIERCGLQYVKAYDLEKITKEYREWVRNQIDALNIHNFNFKSYSHGITVEIEGFNTKFSKFMEIYYGDYCGPESIVEDAIDMVEMERKKKAHEYKKAQMASIIDWIKKNKPEMTDEFEILEFAERIFRKNHR